MRAKPISWVTTSMVMPSSASCRMTESTSPVNSGSSALVGSSKSITSGSIHRARAMATLCFCPPESWLGKFSALSAKPTRSSISRALARACSLVAFFRSTGASIRLRSTFMLLNRLKC